MTEHLRRALIHDEGIRLKPYVCPAGKLTIGVGRNIEDNGISLDEAMHLLESDIERTRSELRRTDFWSFVADDPVRSAVLINLCFNIGLSRLLGFKKMIAAIKAKDWGRAADEMKNSLWYRQTGNRARRLVEEMRTGQFKDLK